MRIGISSPAQLQTFDVDTFWRVARPENDSQNLTFRTHLRDLLFLLLRNRVSLIICAKDPAKIFEYGNVQN